MAQRNEWTFEELEAMDEDQVNDILAEIPSDGESLTDDYLSDDEDDIGHLLENNNDVITENLFTELDDVNNEILLLDEEIDSEEEPLSRIAEKLRATVPISQAVWSNQNFYQESPTFDLAYDVDIDETDN
ncbi:hypothetical protein NQ314_015802 [Rhamnusium bicolor]|uniref:Uncharacterized protein n=1 Tax=Rhamnusium bicolor TaxID=1586634 RepID=A0AAV8X0B9_9CUCU|nr:hypothetical protein NQ314_015802 [Rhamnusium bicolor]